MKDCTWKMIVISLLLMIPGTSAVVHAQQIQADQILTNGKIITVDDRFSIAQAVAIKGDRIVAVGSNQEITQLAGPNTKRVDLKGKSVVPGLIDNHAHYMRAGLTWAREVRLDGVDTRKEAFELLRAKAKTLGPDEWLFTLGGWTRYQFKDDKRAFTREELDQIAPNNPALLQEVAWQSHVNSRAIQIMGLDKKTDKWIERDPSGKPTGVVFEGGARSLGFSIPPSTPAQIEASETAMIRDLNRAGITAFNNSGCDQEVVELFRQWEKKGQLNIRDYCMAVVSAGRTEESVNKALPEIAKIKMFQGDDYLDHTIYGEHFGPRDDNMFDTKTSATPEDMEQWGRIALAVCKQGFPIQVHSTLEGTIQGFLDQIEKLNQECPVRNLRWSLIHLDQLTAPQLERMKKLGLYAGVQIRPTVTGQLFHDIHGERAYDEPPLRMIQNSGIMWGLGTDAMEANQYRPMTTLWTAVTGKMVGGTVINHQTISREDALIAHTRKDSFLIFQEDNLGSIQPGKLADLVVLDRDYLTVPADQIKDIKPVMTMVGGRIVYDAAAASETSSLLNGR